MMTVRMILILLSQELENDAISTGQWRTMPLWLLLSEPAKKRTQSGLVEDQRALARRILAGQKRTDCAPQR